MGDFFEKVKQGIDKGITTVTVKSKEMLETAHLRSQLATLEHEKQMLLAELGNIVYTLVTQQKLDIERQLVTTKCEALATLDRTIQNTEEEIREVQRKAQAAMGQQPRQAMGRCACGADLCEGARFCGSCGKPADGAQESGRFQHTDSAHPEDHGESV